LGSNGWTEGGRAERREIKERDEERERRLARRREKEEKRCELNCVSGKTKL